MKRTEMRFLCMAGGLSGLLLLASFGLRAADTTGMEMDFQGTLVNEPCTVVPDDTSIQLDFGTIIEKNLYNYTRTNSEPFTIHLENCDMSDWAGDGTITVRFEGSSDAALPGYLATDDPTMGIAVGIEEEDGTFLGLGKDSAVRPLSDGTVALNFNAFVQGEPDAITNQTLKLGAFSTTATFFLNYL